MMRFSAISCILALTLSSSGALAQSITVGDANIFPESITATRKGAVIVGSVSQEYIYRTVPGSSQAQRWIDLTLWNSASYGVLADDRHNRLWVCAMAEPNIGGRPKPVTQRKTSLRAFDLTSGRPKGNWPLPGPYNTCNDMIVASDGTVYATDTVNDRILRLRPGAAALEEWYKGREAARVDGIAFVDDRLYFNSLASGKIYRLPIRPDGMAQEAVELVLSRPLKGPDGMRAQDGCLYVADNQLRQVVELTISGDSAEVKVLAEGLQTPTGVAPVKGRLWYSELKSRFWSEPDAGNPNPFHIESVPLPSNPRTLSSH